MAVREFDGADDLITLGGDGAALSAWSMILVVHPLSTAVGTRAFAAAGTGAATTIGSQYRTGANMGWGSLSGDASSTLSFNTTDWYKMGWTKAASSVPRFHLQNLTTAAAAQHQAGTDAGGATTDVSGNWTVTKVGDFHGGGGFGNFRLATLAVLDIVYTDGDFDALDSTADIYALGPDRLWDFNQASTSTDVIDLVTNTDDQTAITGTTVVTGDDPPGWTFGVGAAPAPPKLRLTRPRARYATGI